MHPDNVVEALNLFERFVVAQEKIAISQEKLAVAQEKLIKLSEKNVKELIGMSKDLKKTLNNGECPICYKLEKCEGWCHRKTYP